MRLSHKQKVKLARKLRSPEELKNKVPIFDTKAWNARKERLARKNQPKHKG